MHGCGREASVDSTDFSPAALTDLIPEEDRGDSLRLFQEMVKGERDGFELEHELRKTDGSTAWLRWIGWRVPGSQGDPDCGLVLAQDITEHRAGGVAHDFNNLLTGVLLYCDLLLAGLDSGNLLRKYAEEIRGAGMQATALVRQLLAVARPQSAAPQLLSLNTIAQEMRDLLRRLIGENIDLCFHLEPNLGVVKMDATGAQQILLNLVLNARDAVAAGGRIVVETSNCKMQILESGPRTHSGPILPCAMVVVSDNGEGMDSDTQKRLFQAFFTTKSAAHGTGLGLAMVHDIVTSAGGLIHVESARGCGTRITVLLPLVPEAALPWSTPEAARAKIEGEHLQHEEE